MKINIITNEVFAREDYLSIYANQVNNLDFFIDDGECEEILALDVLDYVQYDQRQTTIQALMKKVEIGGTIIFGGTDYRGLLKVCTNGDLNPLQLNQILFAVNQLPKRSVGTSEEVVSTLKQLGQLVEHITYQNLVYTITARRQS